jgi:AraC-like DNA-binding protein
MVYSVTLLTIFLSIITLWHNWERNRAILLLTAALILFSAFVVQNQLLLSGDSKLLFALLSNINSTYLLPGPLLYFYFRAMTEDEIRFRSTDFLHLIPFIISLVGGIPYLLSPLSHKLEIAFIVTENLSDFKNQSFNVLMPVPLQQAIRSISYFLYPLASLTLVIRARKRYTNLSDPDLMVHYQSLLNWSIVILVSIMISAVSYFFTVTLFLNRNMDMFYDFGQYWLLLSTVVFTLIPASMLIYPNVVYGFIRLKDDTNLMYPISPTIGTTSNTEQATESEAEIPAEKAQELLILKKAILTFFDEKKPYLNENFRIADIAASLEVPAHHISYCFTKVFDESFTQLRTRYRVEHAVRLLKEGSADIYSIEGVGKMSGFASKSSFFIYFKEYTGLTPQQYVVQNRAVSS